MRYQWSNKMGFAGHFCGIRQKNPLSQDIMQFSFHPACAKAYPLSRLSKRMTVRNGFLNTPLSSEDQLILSKVCPGHIFYIPMSTNHGQCIAEWAGEAFKDQTLNDAAHEELRQWLRFDRNEARRRRDGMTPACTGVEGLELWYVNNFMSQKTASKPFFRKQSIKIYKKLCYQGAGWIIITSKGNGVGDLIRAGQICERMWLLARDLKLGIHPLSQVIEEKKWLKKFASLHQESIIPQLILRVGYLKSYPDTVSLRRPVGWFVQT